MSEIQWIAVAVSVVVLFTALVVACLVLLLRKSKKRLDAKELDIKYRDQLFGILAVHTEDIFIMFSPHGFKVDYVSRNIERLLGITVDEVMENVRVLTSSAVDPALDPTAYELETLPVGERFEFERERICKRTGERRWYRETIYRESIDGDEKLILVLSDRTKENLTNLRLEQALEIARSSNEAKSLFLANMSHDIRTPINAIVGMTKIALETGSTDRKIVHCLNAIMLSSEHLLSLINDVLDMSRIESGQMMLREGCCDLDNLIDGIETIILPQAKAKGQSFTVDSSEIAHRTFSADELRVNQILLNLLSNAIKYTPEGGSIRFSVRELEQASSNYARIRFEVVDNGMGMPHEFVERIFEPFERSDRASVSSIQGTGLGMSITKALVDAMGGTIEVESEEGRGSSFFVTLSFRIVDAGNSVAPCDDAPKVRYEFEGRRYLLAEDNELNAEILIELLGQRGASVDWAKNGREAVDELFAKPIGFYDAVFMDVMMPVMDGYEAARAIRSSSSERASDVKIIALTANAFAEDVKAAMDAGMDAHAAKPIDLDELARVLQRVCG